MRYATYLEKTDHEQFSLGSSPRGLANVHMSCWVVVTDAAGNTYNVMRAIQADDLCKSMHFGVYRGRDVLDESSAFFIPFTEVPVVVPFATSSSPESVVYSGQGFDLELFADRTVWNEANGRVQIEATQLGDVCSLYVPSQHPHPHDFVFRSYFGKAAGTIDGEAVEGLYQMDSVFSTPALNMREAGWTDHVHQYWLNWLVEYEDGTYEGGHAFRGMPGTEFTAGHHVVDGRSTARHDMALEFDRTSRGTISAVRLAVGDDVAFEFEQRGSFDWPIHTFGEVASTTRDKKVRRSWNYMETFPHNWGEVERYNAAHHDLFGRYPSLRGMLEGAVVRDERIEWDAPRSPEAKS
ncbi:hypothetical protein [Pseudonocardia xishanensis]|uniref:AttH domain-containing protein n=1 Tax=Pseudonocardia xishanensis TaxID=630995 RepID=A0ABP8RP77_9PSEU